MTQTRSHWWVAGLGGIVVAILAPNPVNAQDPEPSTAQVVGSAQPAITIAFEQTPIDQVVSAFADFAGRSFILGQGVEGQVTARIESQPWDVALQAILQASNLTAIELESGILVVEALEAEVATATVLPLETRSFRLKWQPAAEYTDVVTSLLSDRGSVSVAEATNALVVTDIAPVLDRVARVLGVSP